MPGPSSRTSSHQVDASTARALTSTSPLRRAVPDRVVDEVDDELGEPGGVAEHGEVLGVGLTRTDTVRGPIAVSAAAAWSRSATRTSVTASGATPASRRERSSRSATSALSRSDCAQRPAQRLVVGAHDPVDEVLQQGPLCGQRGAQLVRDGRDEPASLLVGGGEVGGHRVEGHGQGPDLVGAGRRDALAVVPPGHRLGGPGHLAQRRGHPAGQPLGDRQRGRDRHRHAHPPRDLRRVADPGDEHGDHDADADEQPQLDLDRRDRVERARGVHGPTSRA